MGSGNYKIYWQDIAAVCLEMMTRDKVYLVNEPQIIQT